MWIAIVAVGVVVIGIAAYAATGRLGEMPAEPVTDDPRGRVPDGPVDADLLARLVIPRRINGYAPEEVDEHLSAVVEGTATPSREVRFRVVRRGYNMAVVDEILDRVTRVEESATALEEGLGAASDGEPEGSRSSEA